MMLHPIRGGLSLHLIRGGMMLHPIRGGMMPRPIRALVCAQSCHVRAARSHNKRAQPEASDLRENVKMQISRGQLRDWARHHAARAQPKASDLRENVKT